MAQLTEQLFPKYPRLAGTSVHLLSIIQTVSQFARALLPNYLWSNSTTGRDTWALICTASECFPVNRLQHVNLGLAHGVNGISVETTTPTCIAVSDVRSSINTKGTSKLLYRNCEQTGAIALHVQRVLQRRLK